MPAHEEISPARYRQQDNSTTVLKIETNNGNGNIRCHTVDKLIPLKEKNNISQENSNAVDGHFGGANSAAVDSFKSLPRQDIHEPFIRAAVDIILKQAVFEGTSRRNRVVEWVEPFELPSKISLSPEEYGTSEECLLRLISDVIKYSVKTGHPRFLNQLYSSLDPYGLIGQWLTDALNPSVYTYEVSPVFTLMEEAVLKEMRRIIGWKDGYGEGIFCPGGSMANGYAINLARHKAFPDIKQKGLKDLPKLMIFTSEDAHYSIKKLAAFLGFGTENVKCIKTNEQGKMCPEDLRKQIKLYISNGATPLMVTATSGTTVLGAFDPLVPIHDVCREYGIWLHVDAAWGGGALMSEKYRYLLNGIEFADSVTWNPHKLLAVPQQCSCLLSRHPGLLSDAHSLKASYLFQQDKHYSSVYDTGDQHIQCGRRADVLKFWMMWKAKGTSGFKRHVERVFELSRYFADLIRYRPGWNLLLEPECTNVCFRYLPPSKQGLREEELSMILQNIAPIIKERMVKKGSMLITYQPLRDQPNFFRLVLQNSGLTELDMEFIVEEIERLSEDL